MNCDVQEENWRWTVMYMKKIEDELWCTRRKLKMNSDVLEEELVLQSGQNKTQIAFLAAFNISFPNAEAPSNWAS